MNCDWKQDGEDVRGRKVFRCQLAGCTNALYADSVDDCHASCREINIKPGDALEELLTSYGITKEWYTGFKREYGLPPTCHCDDRKEWLNKTADAHPTIANIGVKLLDALKRK